MEPWGTVQTNLRHSTERFSFRVADPHLFGVKLTPVALNVSASRGDSGRFSADVQAAKLPHLGLFSVRIEHAKVFRAPSDYIAVTVPLDQGLTFFDPDDSAAFSPGAAHILWHGLPMDLEIGSPSSLLVVTYPILWLRSLWPEAAATRLDDLRDRGNALSLETPGGRTYWRNINYVWSEICRDASFSSSRSAATAVENCHAELFGLALEREAVGTYERVMTPSPDVFLERAERYIAENLTDDLNLDDMVTAAETSASSLLRAFRLHRGTTPMRYVKQLRLEAVHRALLASNPKTAKVSEVASEYAFFQFGRFAAEYKRMFGELPSETLQL
jgi:AraC-like DNA-binding protein